MYRFSRWTLFSINVIYRNVLCNTTHLVHIIIKDTLASLFPLIPLHIWYWRLKGGCVPSKRHQSPIPHDKFESIFNSASSTANENGMWWADRWAYLYTYILWLSYCLERMVRYDPALRSIRFYLFYVPFMLLHQYAVCNLWDTCVCIRNMVSEWTFVSIWEIP